MKDESTTSSGHFGFAPIIAQSGLPSKGHHSNADSPTRALTIYLTTASTSSSGLVRGYLGLVTVNVMLINNAICFLPLGFGGAALGKPSSIRWSTAGTALVL